MQSSFCVPLLFFMHFNQSKIYFCFSYSQANSKSAQDSEKSSFGEDKLSPLHALFSPPGLQQMQQFLQQVANNGAATGGQGGFNPAQLHHLMQQQQNFLSHHQVRHLNFYTNFKNVQGIIENPCIFQT